MLLAKLRDGAGAGTARMALEMATLGGAACLGRTGELGVLAPGAVGDVAVWSLTGPAFAGAIADPVEAWLRCGPVTARRHDRPRRRWSCDDGRLVHPAPRRAPAPRTGASPTRIQAVTAVRRDVPARLVAHGHPARSRARSVAALVAIAGRAVADGRLLVRARRRQRATVRARSRSHPATIPPLDPPRQRRRRSPSSRWRWSATRSRSARRTALEDGFADARPRRRRRSTPSAGGACSSTASIDSGARRRRASIAGSDPPDAVGDRPRHQRRRPVRRAEEYAAAVDRAARRRPGGCPGGLGRHLPATTAARSRRRSTTSLRDVARPHAAAPTVVDWASIAAQDGVLRRRRPPVGLRRPGVQRPRRRRRRRVAA